MNDIQSVKGDVMQPSIEKKYCYAVVVLMALSFTFLFCGSSLLLDSTGTDSSVFYTIGRGIMAGKVAYRDLFDHKGLYLYLLNALGVMIADHHMLGLWLVETGFVVADCFLVFRIVRKLGRSARFALFTVLLTMVLAACCWEGGNLTETYGLLPELITLLVLLDVFQGGQEKAFPAGKMFVLGVCAGVELFLRANLVMAWIPLAVVVVGTELLQKRFRNAAATIFFGIIGLLTASVIPVLYCLKHACLNEMFFATVLFNLRYVGDGVLLKISSFRQLVRLCVFLFMLVPGVCSTIMVWKKGRSRTGRWLFASSFLFSGVSVLLSGRVYLHYCLYLVPFAIPFLMWFAEFLRSRLRFRWRLVLVTLALLMAFVLNSSFAWNAIKRMIRDPGGVYNARELVADQMQKEYPDVTDLLVVNGRACYYVRLDLVPQQKYFYLPSVSYSVFPDAVDAQADAICDGAHEAVILEWQDRAKKLAMPEAARNDDILSGLNEHYREVYSVDEISLYLRNDAV